MLAKFGVQPQATPGPDLYAALESKKIDAAEWIGPYDDERLGLQKVAPIYHYPGFWEGGAMLHVWINAEKWKGLPRPTKPSCGPPARRSAPRCRPSTMPATRAPCGGSWRAARSSGLSPRR